MDTTEREIQEIAERMQKEDHAAIDLMIARNNKLTYQDASNALMYYRNATIEHRLRKLEEGQQSNECKHEVSIHGVCPACGEKRITHED
jgi:hypothetical protein